MSFWDWGVRAHGREGVDALLIQLQDAHGQCVAYLLWAAWAAAEGRELDEVLLAQGAELAGHWEKAATGPLRHARRELKAPAPPVADDARAALREQVRSAEFAAEGILMETLEALVPEPSGGPRDLRAALLAAAGAWPSGAPEGLLAELAARIR